MQKSYAWKEAERPKDPKGVIRSKEITFRIYYIIENAVGPYLKFFKNFAQKVQGVPQKTQLVVQITVQQFRKAGDSWSEPCRLPDLSFMRKVSVV